MGGSVPNGSVSSVCTALATRQYGASGVTYDWTINPIVVVNDTYRDCNVSWGSKGTSQSFVWSSWIRLVLTCPGGGTLSGSECTGAPDCTPPQVRDVATGQCGAPPCPAAGQSVGAGGTLGGTGSATGVLCSGGCELTSTSCQSWQGAGGWKYACNGPFKTTGASCTGDNNNAQPTTPDSCQAKGMCSGTLNGVTACEPCATTKSDQVSTKSVVNPDGTTTTTTTTTTNTCTGAGACTTTTSSSSSSAPSAPGATPGSTTSSGSAPKNGEGKITINPDGSQKLDLPTDYQRDQTGMDTNKLLQKQIDVMGTPDGDDSAITLAHESSDATDAHLAADGDTANFASGHKTDPLIVTQQSLWQQTMNTGWWEPITMTGCTPFSATISGHNWTLDHCPIASKISNIGAYVAWIGLMFFAFRLITATPSVRS